MRNLTNFLKRFITLLIYSLDIFIFMRIFIYMYLSIYQSGKFFLCFLNINCWRDEKLSKVYSAHNQLFVHRENFFCFFQQPLGYDTKLFTLEIRNFVCGVMGNCCCKCKLLEISRYQHAYHRTFLNVSSSHGVIM